MGLKRQNVALFFLSFCVYLFVKPKKLNNDSFLLEGYHFLCRGNTFLQQLLTTLQRIDISHEILSNEYKVKQGNIINRPLFHLWPCWTQCFPIIDLVNQYDRIFCLGYVSHSFNLSWKKCYEQLTQYLILSILTFSYLPNDTFDYAKHACIVAFITVTS